MDTLEILKKSLSKEYNTKDLGEVQTIIGWQIDWDTASRTMKINQSTFIWDLIFKKKLTKYNANMISIKPDLAIDITEPEDCKEVDFLTY